MISKYVLPLQNCKCEKPPKIHWHLKSNHHNQYNRLSFIISQSHTAVPVATNNQSQSCQWQKRHVQHWNRRDRTSALLLFIWLCQCQFCPNPTMHLSWLAEPGCAVVASPSWMLVRAVSWWCSCWALSIEKHYADGFLLLCEAAHFCIGCLFLLHKTCWFVTLY